MKATGIVRKIDDVGRIVIPREILKTLDIRNRDPMEFCISDDGFILLKKHESSIQILDQIEILETKIKEDSSYETEKAAQIISLLSEAKQLL